MASTAKERGNEALRGGRLRPGNLAPAMAPTPTRDSKETRPRYHAIDALRGMAMFLVISLHAAPGYISAISPAYSGAYAIPPRSGSSTGSAGGA